MELMPRGFGLDDFFDNILPEKEAESSSLMKCDIYEKDGIYHLEMDIPGMKKENVNIDYEDGYLSIIASGSQKHEEKDKDKKYIRRERHYGKYQRKFYVGNINPKDIKAEVNNGSLFISFPKEKEENNKIRINID